MNWRKSNRFLACTFTTLFVLTGTYNAVVINSESHLNGSEVKFVKRLDEIYGVTVQGREVAASVSWQKLAPSKKLEQRKPIIQQQVTRIAAAPETSAPVEDIPVAAVQEELSLSLVEVINPKKWKDGVNNTQFSGSLSANNGVIEELSVSLPNGEGLSVSFLEMTGNVFEYDFNGELYSGMMYQVDQHAYMVTLTNGPLEGTRLRFTAPAGGDQEVAADYLADRSHEIGNNADQYGNNADQYAQAETAPVYEYAQTQDINPQELQNLDMQMQQEALKAQQAETHDRPYTM